MSTDSGRLVKIVIALAAVLLLNTGCGPTPPFPYQPLVIQDTEESHGYDVYLYVSVTKDKKPEDIRVLLKWFDEEKFPTTNKMKIFVWNNPQAALMGNPADLVGTLNVDRAEGVFEMKIPGLEEGPPE
ncbi:MAG TPA: hypothetical protein ENN67_08830 [Firmicutes bacterium]|nr:hypothetical protein [Bacillota bacterium]